MATTAKKKPVAKKKPALKKSKKVNPWLLFIGAGLVAVVGAYIVGLSFAATSWPKASEAYACNTTGRFDKNDQLPNLKKGSRGNCVKTLQNGFRLIGFPPGPVDGIFGNQTSNAAIYLQTYYGLRGRDGVVGKCTWMTLQGANIYGTKTSAKGSVQKYVRSNASGCF